MTSSIKPIQVMGLVVVGLLVALLLLPTPDRVPRDAHSGPANAALNVSALVNARLFDGDAVIDNATILIEQGRVTAVGTGLEVPTGVVPIDAAGTTVLPGLIDAHVHAYAPVARSEALRFGVTTILDMFRAPFDFGVVQAERASMAATDRADLFSAGFLATAPGGHGTQFGLAVPTLTGPEQAAAWVAARKAEGSDWIKIVIESGWGAQQLPTLNEATVRALVEAAHAEGLLAVAHVSRLADARMAVEAGADGLVHLFGDQALDPALIGLMQERGVFVVPTLAVMASIYGGSGTADLEQHPVLASRLGSLQRQTLAQRFAAPGSNAPAWAQLLANVDRLRAAGIPLLAGSDAPNPGTAHGFSLQHEVRLLVEAGLSPLQALHAATRAPALAFGLADRGCLKPGCRADLLIIDGDPTQDIEALAMLDAVWKNGVAVTTEQQTAPAPMASSSRAPAGTMDLLAQRARWVASADSFMGGNSSSRLVDTAGAELVVQTELAAGAPFPYAGAMWFASDTPMQPVDHSPHQSLVVEVDFDGASEGASLQLILFSGESEQAMPARIELEPGAPVEVQLDRVPGLDLPRLRAIGVFVGGAPGSRAFRIRRLVIE